MDSQIVRYIIIILVNVFVLGVFINDFYKWHYKLIMLSWSLRRVLSSTCRMLGLLLIVSNFFVYITGSYAIIQHWYTAADAVFLYMCITIVASSFALLIASEGFKRETQIVRVRRDEE